MRIPRKPRWLCLPDMKGESFRTSLRGYWRFHLFFGCPPDAQFRGIVPQSVTDTQAIQFTQDFRDRPIQRCFYRLAQVAARLVRLSFNSHEKHIGGRDSEQLGAEER